eukprot:3966884-Pyramimonas_sp.AAC.1
MPLELASADRACLPVTRPRVPAALGSDATLQAPWQGSGRLTGCRSRRRSRPPALCGPRSLGPRPRP